MKTKLTLFVAVLAAALFGVGCAQLKEVVIKPFTKRKDVGRPASSEGSNQNTVDISKGLVAHYPFNGDAKDASGNNHHGDVKGASLGEDRHGKSSEAYYFDGKDDLIEVDDSPKLDLGTKGSVSFWMRAQRWSGGSKGILSKREFDTEREPGFVIYRNTHKGSQITIRFEPVGDFAEQERKKYGYWAQDAWTEGNVELETWEHWLVAWDGTTVRWYRNGKLNASHNKPWIKGTYESDVSLQIGHAQTKWSGTYFHGGLDDIRIYNRALSEREMGAIYKLEKPLKTGPTKDELAIEKAIRSVLNKPKGKLDQNDYARVRELDLSNKKIHNISGLTKLRKLKKINLRGNLVADFQPLTKLPELEYLFISTDGVSIDHLHRLGKFESVTEFHLERTHNMNNGTYISALVGKSPNLEKLHLYLPGLYDRSPIYGCKGHAKLKLIDMTHAPQPKDVRDALIKHFNPDKEIIFKENK